ncbi:MAG: phage tail protein [Gammaproteobacteria bacterium]|nr:phage tail protein [Gammaproteobacteria bacterium]
MDETVRRVIEHVQRKYYGKYRGFVTDNEDPEHRARLRLRVPSVLGEEESGWALPCLPFGGLSGQGQYMVPEPGAQVWIEFEEGELSHPIWTGTFWQVDGDAPVSLDADTPVKRTIKTPAGHTLEFDDTEAEEKLRLEHPQGASLAIDENGSVALTDANGATLSLDAQANEAVLRDANGNTLTMTASGTTIEDSNGNRVEMAASGITVQGQQIVLNGTQVMLAGQGGEPIIKGQSFLTLFMTHIHPTGVGPSGPPVPQGELSTLSTKVLTS